MKQIITMLLVLVLCLSVTATAVASAEPTGVESENYVLIPANADFSFEKVLNSDTPETSVIAKDYYMNLYQVTVSEYVAFCEETGHAEPSYFANEQFDAQEKENHPVLYVSFSDALDYCKWLNETHDDGMVYRLPTDAEWENAAKGDTHNTYPWGNDGPVYDAETDTLDTPLNFNAYCAWLLLNDEQYGRDFVVGFTGNYSGLEPIALGNMLSIGANGNVAGWSAHTGEQGFNGCDLYKEVINLAGGTTWEVDSHPEGNSPYGLYNMCGNAWEWTQTVVRAATVPEASNEGAAGYGYDVRGGAWYTTLGSTAISYRGEAKRSGSNTIGFRTAAEEADYAVCFYNEGVLSCIAGANAGETVSEPVMLPIDGAMVTGWFVDEALTVPWNFDTDTVTGDMCLYSNVEAIS